MKLTIGWSDGDQRTLTDVIAFSRSWQGDEYLLVVTYQDGSEEHYTGPDLAVHTASGGGEAAEVLKELHQNFVALEGAAMDAVATMRGEANELRGRPDWPLDDHIEDVRDGLRHGANELEHAIENPPGDEDFTKEQKQ